MPSVFLVLGNRFLGTEVSLLLTIFLKYYKFPLLIITFVYRITFFRLPNEDHIAFGQVKCGTKCLGFGVKDQTVKLQDCSFEDNSQWFLHSTTGKLSTNTGACLNLNGNQVILEYCKDSKNQMWIRRGGKLVHEATGLCLDNTLLDAIVGTECRPGAPSQLFSFSVELQKL